MALKKLLAYTKKLEDPQHPLMGPLIKGLYFFGLWQTGTKFRTVLFNTLHVTTFLFVITEFIDLYSIRKDFNLVLNNMSLTVLSVICAMKTFSFMLNQKKWRELCHEISRVELKQMQEKDPTTLRLMKEYTLYSRVVTYLFWALVFLTNILLIVSPFLKCLTQTYREDVQSGKEPLPQILYSWFPFDNKKMPGYFWGVLFHMFMGCQGSGVVSVFDMNAVAIMSYLKGQTIILREKCRRIFEDESSDVMNRVKECHWHHNVIVKHHQMFNALLSPTMFFYVLVCSITICGSVVQYTSKEATLSQKMWILQYTAALVSQLFIYCWHSNDIAVETREVARGVYESEWWRGDAKLRKQIMLLAGKLDRTLILEAGPYTTLSVPTFIDIIKASYSFFTLFSQMQE